MSAVPRLTARAPAKVNLVLWVGPTRADGLHELVSLFEPLALADDLVLEPAPAAAGADEVVCPEVPGDNLATRALTAFRQATGWDAPPVRLTITKRIPIAGGMAGGSADAAAALRLAAAAAAATPAAGPRPTPELLHDLAFGLGADVPSQIDPTVALVEGAGERVTPRPALPPHAVVVVPLDTELRTPDVYREADRLGTPCDAGGLAERRGALLAALDRGELPLDLVGNDLEPAARALHPAIDGVLADVRATGAARALVSGSGPTVLGLFPGTDGETAARAAADALRDRHPRVAATRPATAGEGDPRPA